MMEGGKRDGERSWLKKIEDWYERKNDVVNGEVCGVVEVQIECEEMGMRETERSNEKLERERERTREKNLKDQLMELKE